MKKMLGLMLYGLTLFGLAAGTGWFLRSQLAPDPPAAAGTADPNAAPLPGLSDTDWGAPVPVSAAAAEGTTGGTSAAGGAATEELPTAIRPGQMSVEEIVRYSLGLKSRDEAIRAREEVLKRSEAQYQLLLADMKGEKQELEGLVAQARDQRLATEQLLKRIEAINREITTTQQQIEAEKKNQQLEAERAKAEAERTGRSAPGPDVDLQATIKSISPILENMSSEKAAETVEEMVRNKNEDLAIGVVGAMDERKASLLLEALKDPQLRNMLLEQQGRRKTTTLKSARGR